ncbi:MAG: hypothetical protein HOP12_11215 [Candidatus Eisenbacteria bacterium]|uniref:peptidylprolyl isomerase n=1 Tax=Eiseniibacteriota bacterium TaxID=2212470 RepID=A0A849SQ06_UNCEI|nr:hypothetical protein [Candidatus Eisenbacteria bacterium]
MIGLRRITVVRMLFACCLLAIAGGARSAGAQAPGTAPPRGTPSRLDGVVATVNDDVILESDVEEQLYLFLMRNQAQPDSSMADTLRRQILQQLIDEKLVVSEAKRLTISVPDAEVTRQVDEAMREARGRMGSQQAFEEQLAKEGLNEEKLRERYRDEMRRQLMAQKLVQRQVPRKPVTAAEAEVYFKANPDKFPRVPAELRLSVIQIPVAAESVTVAKARIKAEALRKRIVAGEKFAKVASEASEDEVSGRAGGDLGYFTRGQFDPDFERAAFSQKIGELGHPVRSSFGWHLIEVLDRDTVKTRAGRDSLDAQGQRVLESHARHILVKVDVTEADIERARTQTEKIRTEITKGGDFARLAERFSKYPGPHTPDGDVGFVSLASLQPQIRAGLDTTQVGEVSEVLVNRSGFNLFKVTDRKLERPYTLEEIRAELPEAVAQVQYRERYDAWIAGLRSKAQVKIR